MVSLPTSTAFQEFRRNTEISIALVMKQQPKKFELYSIVLHYLSYKITENLRKIYLDVDFGSEKIILTAIYRNTLTELELELLDDIVTNSNASIPDFFVEARVKLVHEYNENEKHDFLLFAFFDESRYDQ